MHLRKSPINLDIAVLGGRKERIGFLEIVEIFGREERDSWFFASDCKNKLPGGIKFLQKYKFLRKQGKIGGILLQNVRSFSEDVFLEKKFQNYHV